MQGFFIVKKNNFFFLLLSSFPPLTTIRSFEPEVSVDKQQIKKRRKSNSKQHSTKKRITNFAFANEKSFVIDASSRVWAQKIERESLELLKKKNFSRSEEVENFLIKIQFLICIFIKVSKRVDRKLLSMSYEIKKKGGEHRCGSVVSFMIRGDWWLMAANLQVNFQMILIAKKKIEFLVHISK